MNQKHLKNLLETGTSETEICLACCTPITLETERDYNYCSFIIKAYCTRTIFMSIDYMHCTRNFRPEKLIKNALVEEHKTFGDIR